MTNKQAGLFKDLSNSDWDNLDNYVLWGLYRLILTDEATAVGYGIDAQERLNLIEDVLYCLIANIGDVGAGDQVIALPAPSYQWKQGNLKCSGLWGWMRTQQDWMPNRYQTGNITDVFFYYDIASKISGIPLPNTPASTDWKAAEVKSVLLKQLNYMLGMNPWDVSMIAGIGAKNFNHPHHRASNPELNTSPYPYTYRHPVGAISAGYAPTVPLYDEYMGGNANPWNHTEVSLDAAASIFLPVFGMAQASCSTNVRPPDKNAPQYRTIAPKIRITFDNGKRSVLLVSELPVRETTVFSATGRLVAKLEFPPVSTPANGTYFVPVAGDSPGLYILNIGLRNGAAIVRRTIIP